MIKNNEFSELVLYWDSKEEANREGRPRVNRIIKWFLSHGGSPDMVQQKSLPLCDYCICGGFDEELKVFLPGLFRGKNINIGIEFKELVDYSSSHADLDWKLVDSYLYYSQVALFIQEGDIELTYSDGQTYVRNKAVPNGTADILLYEHMKNEIDRYSRIAEIHVRTFSYETFIDANLDSLMVMVSEEPKVPMYCRGKDLDQEKVAFINSLLYVPKIGVSTAMKFTNYYPNWEVMAEHASYAGEYEAIAGILTGKRVREFIQMGSEKNKRICSRKNECFENRKTLKIAAPESNEEKYIPMDKEQKIVVADAIYEYLYSFYPDGKTPIEICKHFDCQDEHIKDMLICIKRMAENGRITSTIKGIFIVIPKSVGKGNVSPQRLIQIQEENAEEIAHLNTSPMTSEIEGYTEPNEDVSKSLNNTPITDATKADTLIQVKDSRNSTGRSETVPMIPDNTSVGIVHDTSSINESAKTDKINSLDILDTPSIEQKAMQDSSCNLDTQSPGLAVPLDSTPVLQSQSTEQQGSNPPSRRINKGFELKRNKAANDVVNDPMSGETKRSTLDNLQSPQTNTIITPPILCGDKVGEIPPSSTTFIPKPVIQSLDDVIVDFCYENPKADFSIISYCQSKGYVLPDIHKALSGLSKTKLYRYKEKGMEMYSYKLLKADVDFDIGV